MGTEKVNYTLLVDYTQEPLKVLTCNSFENSTKGIQITQKKNCYDRSQMK